MRPEIPPEELAKIEASWQEFLDNPPDDLAMVARNPVLRDHMREPMLAGWWLENRLLELGATKEECESLCFAHGQHCFGRDPWVMAQFVLDGYKAGNPEKPGPELAERICRERMKIVEDV